MHIPHRHPARSYRASRSRGPPSSCRSQQGTTSPETPGCTEPRSRRSAAPQECRSSRFPQRSAREAKAHEGGGDVTWFSLVSFYREIRMFSFQFLRLRSSGLLNGKIQQRSLASSNDPSSFYSTVVQDLKLNATRVLMLVPEFVEKADAL